jgi:protein-arginine kinase activator protein McsA
MDLSNLLNDFDEFLRNAKLISKTTFEQDGDVYCKTIYQLSNGGTVEKITVMSQDLSEDLMKLEELRDRLRSAVEHEDYELAAKLKKEADELQQKLESEESEESKESQED